MSGQEENAKAGPYADIIGLPHPRSKKHPPMDLLQRAAQFAPFAALNGHKEAIDETADQAEEAMRPEYEEMDGF